MKLLATEVIVSQGVFGDSFLDKLERRSLKKQLENLESGAILQQRNIRNAIEQDFFGWYPEAWTPELHQVLWRFVKTLAAYDIGTFEIKPDRARDLLKDLYHGLIPETVRHALGEYYTPDWLAEHTVDLSGYDGDPSKTFLDPACGSGTFLVLAIQRARQWLSDHSVDWASKEKKREAIGLICHNIVGFDLNPLAVIASRTNYMFALGPLLQYRKSGAAFEIPVYLTDSVLLPGQAQDGQLGLYVQDTVSFPMTVGTFDLPAEAVRQHRVPDLMNLLHEAIVEGHTQKAFVKSALKQLSLSDGGSQQTTMETLFNQMKKLDNEGKNSIWAKLIRNRYAALFFHHYFDFVVGNPPHVNWESLTPEWRAAAEGTYKRYGLFTLKGLESQHGGGKKDIAALFTYAVMDHFVRDNGVLALIVHVSLFKTSGAGEGYRRFQLGYGEKFCVEEAHDFRSFQPFQTHSGMRIKTRTFTFRATKGKPTKYPIPYNVWEKTERGFIPGGLKWNEAEKRLASKQIVAVPLRGTTKEGRLSPWLTVPESKLRMCRKVIAPPNYEPHYDGHAGFNTGGLNGCFFLNVLERYPNGTVLIENMHDVGKISCKKVRTTIEDDLVFPLLRGRSIGRWKHGLAGHVLLVQDRESKRGYLERWMQETHPLTWTYLRTFEKQLRARSAYKKFYSDDDPFYSMYNIGSYTFAPHKVVWMDVSANMKTTVVSSDPGNDMPMPEHKLMLLTTETESEAHYVASVLNSEPFDTVVSGYIVDNSVSTHPIANIRIPKFDPADSTHSKLSEFSREAHEATSRQSENSLKKVEREIDRTARKLWS